MEPTWKMKLFLKAYLFWIQHGGNIGQIMVNVGLPVMSAVVAKKIYSKYIMDLDFLRRYRRAKNAKAYARRTAPLNAVKRRVRKLEAGRSGKEWKTHDVNVGGASLDTTGAVTLLNGIAQGDQSINREGLRINLGSVHIKWNATSNTANTDGALGRVMLVLDKGCTGTAPAITDILESISVLNFKEHDKRQRFVILYDKRFSVDNQGTAASPLEKTYNPRDYYKKFKKLQLKYGGTGDTVASCYGNTLFWVAFGNQATNAPSISCRVRLRFTD